MDRMHLLRQRCSVAQRPQPFVELSDFQLLRALFGQELVEDLGAVCEELCALLGLDFRAAHFLAAPVRADAVHRDRLHAPEEEQGWRNLVCGEHLLSIAHM
eukprot:3724949-Rhodomonas_salina.1